MSFSWVDIFFSRFQLVAERSAAGDFLTSRVTSVSQEAEEHLWPKGPKRRCNRRLYLVAVKGNIPLYVKMRIDWLLVAP
jgi:hypothetical protein